MKKIFALLIVVFVLSSLMAQAKEREVKDSDIEIALAALKKLGIDKDKVEIDKRSMSWQQSCWDSVVEGDDPQFLVFQAVLTESIKVKGLDLPAPTIIGVCDDTIDSILADKILKVSGYSCSRKVSFRKDGGLCECHLAEDAVVKGVKAYKGSDIYLFEKREPIIMVPTGGDKAGRSVGFYDIKNGKAVKNDIIDGYPCNLED